MKIRAGYCCLVGVVLAALVPADTCRADSPPGTLPCGHQGHCLCVPFVRNYGYYPTQWRRWSTEARRDEHFPESLGRERIPTPPGEPTEPLPIERVPMRPMPDVDQLPVPDDILPPDRPFEPEVPFMPEPAVPDGIPPFVPSTTPGAQQAEGVPGLPASPPLESPPPLKSAMPSVSAEPFEPSDSPAPLQPSAEPAVPERPQGSLQRRNRLDDEGEMPLRFEPNMTPAGPGRDRPLRQPEAWVAESRPRFDTVRHPAPIDPHRPAEAAAYSAPESAGTVRDRVNAAGVEPAVATTSFSGPPGVPTELALDGFCPVTLCNLEQWRQGRREHVAVYQNQTFHMAGPEERRQFLAQPARFAPMFGGIDPVLVVDEQRWAPGSIQYIVTYKGRIFMLSSEANLKRFHENPGRYAFEPND